MTEPAFLSRDYQRMWDLVRSQRGPLLDANLITMDEYVALLGEETQDAPNTGSPAPRRLESYDELRAQLAEAQRERDEAQQSWRCFQCGMVLTTEREARDHFGEKPCVSIVHMRELMAVKDQLAAANDARAVMAGAMKDATAVLNEQREQLRQQDAQLAALRARRCGNCADWVVQPGWRTIKSGRCESATSECGEVTDGEQWSADHGCPHHRAKAGQ